MWWNNTVGGFDANLVRQPWASSANLVGGRSFQMLRRGHLEIRQRWQVAGVAGGVTKDDGCKSESISEHDDLPVTMVIMTTGLASSWQYLTSTKVEGPQCKECKEMKECSFFLSGDSRRAAIQAWTRRRGFPFGGLRQKRENGVDRMDKCCLSFF